MQTWSDIAWILYILIMMPVSFFLIWLTINGFGMICFALFTPTSFLQWFKENVIWPISKH